MEQPAQLTLPAQIDRCFGFDTAVEEAQRALLAAKVEASSAFKGIGLVKLMGRQSGFIAMQASMASGVVDVCLIPEVCAVWPDIALLLPAIIVQGLLMVSVQSCDCS